MALPFFALVGLFFGDLGFLHGHHGRGHHRVGIVTGLAANQYAISRLKIGELQRSGFLQVFGARGHAKKFGVRGYNNLYFSAGVRGQSEGVAGNSFDGAQGRR